MRQELRVSLANCEDQENVMAKRDCWTRRKRRRLDGATDNSDSFHSDPCEIQKFKNLLLLILSHLYLNSKKMSAPKKSTWKLSTENNSNPKQLAQNKQETHQSNCKIIQMQNRSRQKAKTDATIMKRARIFRFNNMIRLLLLSCNLLARTTTNLIAAADQVGIETRECLVGEQVDLECTGAQQHQRTFIWFLGPAPGDTEFLNMPGEGIVHSAYTAKNYTLVPPPPAGSPISGGDESIINTTLRIKPVQPRDEIFFECKTNGQRLAAYQLRVLEYPRKVTLVAHEQREDDSQQVQLGLPSADEAAPASVAVPKLTVHLNTRLKLHCSSDEAAPKPELVWRDSDGYQVGNENEPAQGKIVYTDIEKSDNNATNTQEYQLEHLNWPSQSADDKLQHSSSTLKFRVALHHDKALFTCIARHPAFQRPSHWPHLLGKEPSKSIQLEVIYAPQISLNYASGPSSQAPIEGEPFAFQCELIRAFPEEVSYHWLVDDELVVNATEQVLRVEAMPRYLREIKCLATNAAGSSQATLRPAIQYGPAFVGHLLPSPPDPSHKSLHTSAQVHKARANHEAQSISWAPRAHEQLALGFDLGASFNISCPFDASPRPSWIDWFKVSTGYADMKRVQPDEADQLIERGMSPHGIVSIAQTPKGLRSILIDYEAMSAYWNAEWNAHTADQHEHYVAQMSAVVTQQPQLSNELSVAGNDLPTFDRLPTENSINLMQNMETSETESQKYVANITYMLSVAKHQHMANAQLPSEPLAWFYQQQPEANATLININLSQTNSTFSKHTQQATNKLVFMSPSSKQLLQASRAGNGKQHQHRQQQQSITIIKERAKRPALITYSKYEIKQANEDAMGFYVCHAGQTVKRDSNRELTREASRSIFVVAKKKPRIVSTPQQSAQLGLREIKIDCLIQVNTIAPENSSGNANNVVWFKDNKAFVVHQSRESSDLNQVHKVVNLGMLRTHVKNYTIIEQYSPDLLFLRSQLRIEGADLTDFGRYTCAINNSLGADSLHIHFAHRTQPAFYWDAMSALFIGCGVIFFSIVCFLLVYLPRAAPFGQLLLGPNGLNAKTNKDKMKQFKLDQPSQAKLQHDHARVIETVTPCSPSQKGAANAHNQQQNSNNNHLLDDKSSSGNSSAHSEELTGATSGSESGALESRVDTVDAGAANATNSGLLKRICAHFGMQNGQQAGEVRTSLASNKPAISLPMCLESESAMVSSSMNLLKHQQHQQNLADSGAGSDATTATTTANGTNDNSRSSSSVGPAPPAKPVASAYPLYHQHQQQHHLNYYPAQSQPTSWPQTTAYDTIYSPVNNQHQFVQPASVQSHYVTASQYSAPIQQHLNYSPPAIPAKPQQWPPTTLASINANNQLEYQSAYQVVRTSPSSSLSGSHNNNTLHVSLKQAYPKSQTYVTLPVRPASTAQCFQQSGQHNNAAFQLHQSHASIANSHLSHQEQPQQQHYHQQQINLPGNLHQISTTLASSDAGDSYNFNRKLASLNDEIYGTRLINNNNSFAIYGNTNKQQQQFNVNNKQANLDLSKHNSPASNATHQAKLQTSLTSLSQSSSMATNQTDPTSINNNHPEHPNMMYSQQQQVAGSSGCSSSQISPVMTLNGSQQAQTTFSLHEMSPKAGTANESPKVVVAAGAAASLGTHV